MDRFVLSGSLLDGFCVAVCDTDKEPKETKTVAMFCDGQEYLAEKVCAFLNLLDK